MTRDDAIALKIVCKAMIRVKSQLEPLTYAVNLLEPQIVQDDIGSFMTDGRKLYFNSRMVTQLYEQGRVKYLEYQIIHILLHGILGHFSDTNYVAKKLAWRVMDLQVEQIMEKIGLTNNDFRPRPMKYQTIGMSLYQQSLRDNGLRKYVLQVGFKRQVDDHTLWWMQRKKDSSGGNGTQGGETPSSGEEMSADKWKKAREYLLGNDAELTSETICTLTKKLKSKNKGYGSDAGSDIKCIKAEGNSYSFYEVFKEFLRNKTVSKDQPDYLDPMLYQYGFDVYGNIPLVEPMEEIEEVRLSNMVIAIDTSGSCEEYVSLFLAQIISIFQDIGTHFSFEKIFLCQCDSSIKNVCEFSDVEELKEIDGKMMMYGFGGTSFTPVFRWIEKNLTNKGEQVDCLLYLTDGEADFTMNIPEYPVFFIIPEEEMKCVGHIPGWIRKVAIKSE